MNVLVTGGAGFIGGHITEEPDTADHDITVIDNFVPYYDLGIKEKTSKPPAMQPRRLAAATNLLKPQSPTRKPSTTSSPTPT
jgi:nucleoside-diphosphate-sugar epimerase